MVVGDRISQWDVASGYLTLYRSIQLCWHLTVVYTAVFTSYNSLYSCVYILQQSTQLCLHPTIVGSMAGWSPLHILGPQTCLLAEGWFPANILARRNPKRHFSSLGSLAVWRRRWLKSELGLHRTKKRRKKSIVLLPIVCVFDGCPDCLPCADFSFLISSRGQIELSRPLSPTPSSVVHVRKFVISRKEIYLCPGHWWVQAMRV